MVIVVIYYKRVPAIRDTSPQFQDAVWKGLTDAAFEMLLLALEPSAYTCYHIEAETKKGRHFADDTIKCIFLNENV